MKRLMHACHYKLFKYFSYKTEIHKSKSVSVRTTLVDYLYAFFATDCRRRSFTKKIFFKTLS